ncbi:hypothetical protein PF010_g19252 [Phytophthora fragariae]|uniref:Uncharacterized protein n=1 Tax=Phytophthora fragariae TaxID=53985 RepID=A0A6G0KI93_9STRA|nr:hypothetical protein PF010_g19252 [Phytophthora fragariae]KAE9171882.1 hypothetical protein PF004_g27433 [Phytophthora fragariae]
MPQQDHPAATRDPSGDTSGEGDTADAGGQATNPLSPAGSRANSQAGSPSDADDAVEENDGNGGGSPAEHPADAAQNRPVGITVPDNVPTDSAGMRARHHGMPLLDRTGGKTFGGPEGTPSSGLGLTWEHTSPIPTRLLCRSIVPGTNSPRRSPLITDHRLQGSYTRDGYGDLETLVQVEELNHVDMMDLQEIFADDNPVVADLVLSSRASATPGDELESTRHSIPAQREMAVLLSEYGVDRLAERTFTTVSILRRVLDRYRRVCHQLDASPSQSRQDALRAQDQLHAAKLSYEFDRARWESERQQSADAATYTAERYQDDVKELVHEHNANKRGLQEEVSKLRQELEDAHAYQRVLDRRVRESRFNVTDLMNFLGDNSTLACNWVRLRDLLQHYQDRTPFPQS